MNFLDPNALLYSYFVKYDRLTELINYNYRDSGATSIDIFIDVYSIVKSFDKCTITNDNKLSLAAGIINMCAHYRNFFRTRYQTESRFFIIWSNYYCKYNNLFIREYSKETYISANHPEVFNNVMNSNISIIEKLTPYLPDITYIDTIYEFGVRVAEIIDKNENNNPKLIITKDVYNLQLISLPADIKILRPMKYKGEDLSYMIGKESLLHNLFSIRKCNYIENNIDPGLTSVIFALNRLPERHIKSIYNLDTVVKVLNRQIQDGIIINGYNFDISYILNNFDKYHKSRKKINTEEMMLRFKAIDVIYQYGIYKSNPEKNIYNGILNLYNPEEIKNINNTIFKNNPLDLMSI